MRILVLQYMFQNDGSTNALLRLLDKLSLDEYDFLLLYSRRSDEIRRLKDKGYKCVQIPYLMSSDRGYKGIKRLVYLPLYMMINTLALLNMIFVAIFYRPDIIHTNVSPIHLGYYLSKILHIPHIWHVREFRRKESGVQPIFNYSYFLQLLNSSATIATTRSIRDYYCLNNCKVIYDGVIDKQHISRHLVPLKERRKSFLFVGRVEQSKGIEILIDSFSRFAEDNNDWDLDIVGGYSDSYYEFLQNKISLKNVGSRIHFLGVRTDVDQLMSERKVVIVSSLSEGFGYVTVEAMNNKCFVIANDNTGTKEQLDNAKAIIGHDVAFRFRSEDELLIQMRKFATEEGEEHQRLVDEAYEIVNELYSVERCVVAVSDYYKQLL